MTDHGQTQGLPATWTRVQLGDVGVVHCGQSPPTAAVNKEGRGTPYVTGPEQWDGSRLHMDKWTTEPKRMAPAGSVFVTVKGAGVGTVFPGVAAAIGRDVYAFEPKAGVSPSFVEHALRFTVQDVIRHAVGDIPGLSKSHITDHWIGLPPPEEQQLIVAAIESHFSRLDAATATLERVQRNLERYRASVLKAAVEGRLVPTEAELAKKEGHSYEPASVLLKRILAERRRRWEEAEFAKLKAKGKPPTDDRWRSRYEEPAAPDTDGLPELPEGWCWAGLEQLLTHLTSGSRDWTDYYDRGAGVFLMAQNVRPGRLDLSFVQHVDPPSTDASCARSQVEEGDLLVTIVGANTGDVCRIPRPLPKHYVCQSVALMRPAFRSLSRYLDAYLNSPPGQAVFNGFMYGQGRPHLGFEQLETTPVPLPPADEAERIVALVEDKISVAAAVAAPIGANKSRIARLRHSLLKWAFEGRLVQLAASYSGVQPAQR